jgi:flagellar basal-body rod modification protein FlgD
MAVDATFASPVVSGTTSNTSSTSSTGSTSSTSSSTPGIADNFQTFLTLLTTQLQNQNPLDPLDTNQFTQQLVQFAGVEQQLKQNDQLASLISIEKSTQSTQALAYVGSNVAVDGSTTQFNGSATWNVQAPQNTNATLTITNAAGQTCYTGNFTLSDGNASFVWDGKGNDGTQWPSGTYTMTATGKDQTGNNVGITTEIQGLVDSVDMTSSPPLLSIGGQTYTTDKIKRVVRSTTSSG